MNGVFVAPPATGRVVEELGGRGITGLKIKLPEMTFSLPTIELPSIYRFREKAHMRTNEAIAPFMQTPTTTTQFAGAGVGAGLARNSESARVPESNERDPESAELDAKCDELEAKLAECNKTINNMHKVLVMQQEYMQQQRCMPPRHCYPPVPTPQPEVQPEQVQPGRRVNPTHYLTPAAHFVPVVEHEIRRLPPI